ncbi:MAG: hypothetical protein NXH90_14500 [Flavobacteriaceae bacterium]|nr:hypothetical protein [Flavobacteriaceae bacterium]
MKFLLPPTERQEEVLDQAAARWERIIIKDVPSITGTIPSAFEGFPPSVNGTLDDIVIEVALAPIDGPGGVLGQAGPNFVRTSDFLPISGVMYFDVEDLEFLETLDLFEDVIVHEMGHVLGIGTLWNTVDFGFDRTLMLGGETTPYFAGHCILERRRRDRRASHRKSVRTWNGIRALARVHSEQRTYDRVFKLGRKPIEQDYGRIYERPGLRCGQCWGAVRSAKRNTGRGFEHS